MNSRAALPLTLAATMVFGLSSPASATDVLPGTGHRMSTAEPAPRAAVDASPMTAGQRADFTRRFIAKWGYYVQRVHEVPLDTWAERMAPGLAKADPSNLRAAMQRDTFEGAMAELAGTGQALSDDAAITLLAGTTGKDGTQALGALTNDLVYTPIAPCRILDTRSAAAGAIAGNSTRNFVAINASNFTSQGGSATNCGTLGLNATAVAVNLTAVTPSGAGYATAYPFGTAQPLVASVNYTAGAIVNNALIIQIPNPLSSFDFTLYTFAQSHYVGDIVGYFAPPVATALQCTETANESVDASANGGTVNANAPACPTGYTQTATNCETTSWLMPIVYFQSGTCSARNGETTVQTLRASRTCCRVPGR